MAMLGMLCIDAYLKDLAAFEASAAMQDENFGPVIPIYRYSELKEVIAFVKARAKPLALYCFTTDATQAKDVLRYGMHTWHA